MIKILTIIGLVLQFLSFWLAAPEILGPKWIEKTEGFLRKIINKIPTVILTCLGAVTGIIFYHSIQFDTFWIFALIGFALCILLIFNKQIESFFRL